MKRALLVGIDDYVELPALNGCVNDVNALLPLLARNEDNSVNFNCMSLTSPTRRNLLSAIDSLLAPGADVALFYFAGHGKSVKGDVLLMTHDAESKDGISVAQILDKVTESPLREIILILDCCFAGRAEKIPPFGEGLSLLRIGTSMLTATRDDQMAVETPERRGLFSTHLCGALDGGAADVLGFVSMAGVYAYLSESFGAWHQRPTFKANVDRLHIMRGCAPEVPLRELRRLPEFFPSPDYEFPLNPSYEPDAEPRNSEHEAIFYILQRYRAAKLVEPVGAEHMYFAALQSKSCRLTPLGKHYWQMADRL
jgi:hypothetical protein